VNKLTGGTIAADAIWTLRAVPSVSDTGDALRRDAA